MRTICCGEGREVRGGMWWEGPDGWGWEGPVLCEEGVLAPAVTEDRTQ